MDSNSTLKQADMFVHAMFEGREVLYKLQADDNQWYVSERIDVSKKGVMATLESHFSMDTLYVIDNPIILKKTLGGILNSQESTYAFFTKAFVLSEGGSAYSSESGTKMLEASYDATKGKSARVYVNDASFRRPEVQEAFGLTFNTELCHILERYFLMDNLDVTGLRGSDQGIIGLAAYRGKQPAISYQTLASLMMKDSKN